MNSIRNSQSAFRNLILIGYRGTGKTTVGQILAERLSWAFVDADDEIQRRAGQTIAEIFRDHGEPYFRDLEREVVADLVQREQTIVSLGGGAVLRETNRRAINTAGGAVWLTAPATVLLERISADAATAARRPNLTALGGLPEIEKLLAVREPLYRECATLVLGTDGRSTQAIVEDILRHMPALGAKAIDG